MEENNNNNEINIDNTIEQNTNNDNLSKHERKLLKKREREEEIEKVLETSNKKEKKGKALNYIAISIVVIAILFFVIRFFSNGSDGTTGSTINVNIETSEKVKGDPNAPVTIVEYSDFECQFCQRFYQQTLPQIEQQYISTGKVKLIYKHFPLSNIHFSAQSAAEASECANEQGKFWEYHDILFDNSPRLSKSNLNQYATQIGLNVDQFTECLDSRKYREIISQDTREGSSNGISGTPGFLINGQLISGAQPFSVFQQLIEKGL
tara:strand:- start:41613 stop:42404 length:792 start_codon:yes stop_codon:yes gene_type:complete